MADDTTDDFPPEQGTAPETDSTEEVTRTTGPGVRANPEADQTLPDQTLPDQTLPDQTLPDQTRPVHPVPTVSGPPTDQWEPTSTAQHARAYSDIANATTGPVAAPADWRSSTGTSRFPTGEDTAIDPAVGSTGTQPKVVTSAPSRGGKGKFIAIGAVGLVLVIIIALVGSELYLRSRVTSCLESQFSSLTGASTSVSLSKKPILLQKFSNDFPYVQVDTADDGSTGIRLHARADGLSQNGDALTIGSLAGTGYVPFQRVIDLSQQQTAGSTGQQNGGLPTGTSVTSVVGNGADGTVKVDATVTVAVFPVPVSLTVKPVVNQGKVTFTVEQASAFVFGIPADFAQQFVDGFGDTLFGDFTKEIQVQSLKVTDQGVDFAVSGNNVNLTSASTAGSTSSSSCSLI